MTRRVSVGPRGVQANNGSGSPSISANGRFVAFRSEASNLVPGDTNGEPDVFVHDLEARRTVRASVGTGGVEGNGDSEFGAALSADGRYVASRRNRPIWCRATPTASGTFTCAT